MNDEISLQMLWMDLHMSQQSNLKSLTRKTYSNSLIQQPNWLELVLHGEQNLGHSTVKYVGNTFVFLLRF